MRRRDVIALLAAAWPVVARAQQNARIPRIGVLLPGTRDSHGKFLASFQRGLTELGYEEGRNFYLELRWAEGRLDRLPVLAAELVGRKVDVIVVASGAATLAARQATSTIPIVQASGADLVDIGAVASLARPGGNITGMSNQVEDFSTKLLELIVLINPSVSRIGILINPTIVTKDRQLSNIENSMQQAAQALHVTAEPVAVSDAGALEQAFDSIGREKLGALVVLSNPLFVTLSHRIVTLAARSRLPVIYPYRSFVADGGLMSYGIDLAENYRRAANFVDRILNGAKPADLPVQQPTKFELIINLAAAKVLGLTIPPQLLARADEVIE